MADVDLVMVTHIEGLEELEEAFTQGDKRCVKKFLRRVEMRAAQVLVDGAKENAPELTGLLIEVEKRMSVSSDGALTVRVGPSSEGFYGIFQEFGAPEAHVPALHWLEDSARERQDKVLEEYYAGLQEGIEDMKK